MRQILEYSIVIPVYNEKENLKPLHQRIKQAMCSLSDDYEIIFVDDGSTDRSYELLKGMAFLDKKVKVLSFDRNYGQHPAVIAGFRKSSGRFVVTLDADLQNPPEEIHKIVTEIKKGYDMVAGRRTFRKDSFTRRSGSFVTNFIIYLLTSVKLKDYGTMLRVFTKDLAKEVARRYEKERLYIPVLVCKITKNISEVDIFHDRRFRGVSKYSYTRLFKALFSIILRYFNGMYKFLQDIRLVPKDSQLYAIKFRIEDGAEKTLV